MEPMEPYCRICEEFGADVKKIFSDKKAGTHDHVLLKKTTIRTPIEKGNKNEMKKLERLKMKAFRDWQAERTIGLGRDWEGEGE